MEEGRLVHLQRAQSQREIPQQPGEAGQQDDTKTHQSAKAAVSGRHPVQLQNQVDGHGQSRGGGGQGELGAEAEFQQQQDQAQRSHDSQRRQQHAYPGGQPASHVPVGSGDKKRQQGAHSQGKQGPDRLLRRLRQHQTVYNNAAGGGQEHATKKQPPQSQFNVDGQE